MLSLLGCGVCGAEMECWAGWDRLGCVSGHGGWLRSEDGKGVVGWRRVEGCVMGLIRLHTMELHVASLVCI